MMDIKISTILNFWFKQIEPKQWWVKDPGFDQDIASKFSNLHQQAVAGELAQWRINPEGRLAEIIVLDQFSRNIYRNTALAFAADPLALCLAQTAIAVGDDKHLSEQERQFLYLPFMHSESSLIHQEAVELYLSIDKRYGYDFELKHKAIIDRFGRYPHRNDVLNRQSTADELEFIKTPDSGF